MTRFLETYNDKRFIMKAVVTAVEATHAAAASATGEIHMVSRASVCYHVPKCNFPCHWAPCWAY